MPASFEFQPPTIDPRAVLAVAKEAAEEAGAHVLLAASQPLVPVDTGELVKSGTVGRDEVGAYVSYSAVNEADGYNYAAKQHEDATLNHPNGGQANYLGEPMHTAAPAILAAEAAVLHEAT